VHGRRRWLATGACAVLAAACQRTERVEVTTPAITLTSPGATQVITANVFDQDRQPIETAELTFVCDKPEVARVAATGRVTALKSGLARVSVKSGDKEGSVAVDVRIPAKIDVPSELTIQGIDGTTVVSPKVLDDLNRPVEGAPVALKSADSTKATIQSDNKTILAKGFGETIVTATSGKVSTPIKVTIAPPPVDSVSVEPTGPSLKVDETQQLVVTAKAKDGTIVPKVPVAWLSSDPDVATVDANGLVTAVGPGSGKITVVAGDKSTTVEIKITK